MRDESWAWLTLISPLYMKSTIACTSHSLRSLRTITGCLQGVSSKMRWKYGLQIAKHILISLQLSFSHHEKLTSVIALLEMEFLIIFLLLGIFAHPLYLSSSTKESYLNIFRKMFINYFHIVTKEGFVMENAQVSCVYSTTSADMILKYV